MIYGGHAIFACPIYFLHRTHVTFCGIFHKVKDMPTGPINFLLLDMPRVIPQVLEYRQCEMYIMISFCRTCHDRASFRSVQSSLKFTFGGCLVRGRHAWRSQPLSLGYELWPCFQPTPTSRTNLISSDDLESEVERGSNFPKTTPSTAKHCLFIFLL